MINPKVSDLMDLSGRSAVITGAASGIGRASAELLAEAGAAVALLDVNDELGDETRRAIERSGGEAVFEACDVSSPEDCRRAVGSVMERFGRIDILFNNAGIIRRRDAVQLSEAEWDLTLDISLKGAWLMSRQVVPHMIRGGGGSIINTGSGWSLKGGPRAVAYCAAKAGILNMTRAMALDFGAHNIRVNCVCPGDIDTPLLRGEAADLGRDWEEFAEEAADRPLRRLGTPEDAAKAVLFFAGDLSSWVTGAHLVVDGGGLA